MIIKICSYTLLQFDIYDQKITQIRAILILYIIIYII